MTSHDSSPAPVHLPTVGEQAEHLIALGVPELAGVDPAGLQAMADDGAAQSRRSARSGQAPDGTRAHPQDDGESGPPLLVLPGAPIAALAALMQRAGKPGFVVQDMIDVDEFAPVPGVEIPQGPYLVHDLDRGDHLRNASPEEAQEQFTAEARTPLTLTEGILWVLAHPPVLEPNKCFMTIASRLRKPGGRFDARTPALWISGGTGRDGTERKNAAKVGWCWWRNRHTWLGLASASHRRVIT